MKDSASPGGAWVWTSAGEPDALHWQTREVPQPGPGEARVRNVVAGLNPVDWKFIEWGPAAWRPGQIPGVDGAGDVDAVGAGVDSGWLGSRVAYHQDLGRAGSFATHTIVAARALMRVPPGLSYETAASLPCPALTAWQALEKVPLDIGAPVLVSGAGGAVGALLVQLARDRGFVVTAMCNLRHEARLRALGVVDVVPGSRAEADWTGLRARYFHAIFDTVSGVHAATLAPLVASNGHLVCIQDRQERPPLPAFSSAISLHEVALNSLHTFGSDRQWERLTQAGEALMDDVLHDRLQALGTESGPLTRVPALLAGLKHHTALGRPVARA